MSSEQGQVVVLPCTEASLGCGSCGKGRFVRQLPRGFHIWTPENKEIFHKDDERLKGWEMLNHWLLKCKKPLGTMNILLTLAMNAGVQIRCELSCCFRIFRMVFVAVGHA